VSPNDPNHILELNRFLGQLVFSAFSDKFVCTPADLIRLGRRADPSNIDDEAALRHGCTQFKVSLDNLIQAHRGMAWAAENIVIAVAGGADGTSGLKDAADATLREEIEKAAQAIFASSLNLTAQITEKEKLVARYESDRKNLLPKGQNKTSERLQALIAAAETVRGYLRYYATLQASLVALKGEVLDVRLHQAPSTLRSMKKRHSKAGLDSAEWERFLLDYSLDVDAIVTTKAAEAEKGAASWKGLSPASPADASGSFLAVDSDVARTPLAVLEAEIARFEELVAADKETANRIAAITKRLTEETTALERLREKLKDCRGARTRADTLVTEREQGYTRVFEAVLAEEHVLNELYAPLRMRLEMAGGTLARLSFTVTRVADVAAWAKRGEALFDLRGGPFKGIGSLEKEANTMLLSAWTTGDAAAVSGAITESGSNSEDVQRLQRS
jgi:hypothetical protein